MISNIIFGGTGLCFAASLVMIVVGVCTNKWVF